MYGAGWETCRRCGVKDRVAELEKRNDGATAAEYFIHPTEQEPRCRDWKREREAAVRG